MANRIRSTKELRLRTSELAENPSIRAPIILCVDTSNSMNIKQRIQKMNQGIQRFIHDMKKDPIAADSVELCVVAYGGEAPEVAIHFDSIGKTSFQPLVADGGTCLYLGVRLAHDLLQEALQEYQELGIENYRPWMIIIGDGNSDNDMSRQEMRKLEQKIAEEYRQKHINILAINVGEARHDMLDRFSPDGKAHKLQDLKFDDFFYWLSRSVQKMSQSLAGEEIQLESTVCWEEVLI